MNFFRITLSWVLFYLFICSPIIAQECIPDTSHTVKTSLEEVINFNKNKRISSSIHYIPILIHAVKDSSGNMVDETELAKSIISLNEKFQPANMEFVLCNEINYITSEEFFEIDDDDEHERLIAKYNNPNTVDIFYVGSINHRFACGYASLGWFDDGYVVIQNSCVNNMTLEHEMGHYFNLYHTHETAYGKELVDGSNCSTSGDLICDTPADPNLLNQVSLECNYQGENTDDNGQLYNPPVTNIMSYSNELCKSKLTPQQYQRIIFHYEKYYKNTLGCSDKPDFTISLDYENGTFLKGTEKNIEIIISNKAATDYNGMLSCRLYLENSEGIITRLSQIKLQKSLPGLSSDSTIVKVSLSDTLKDQIYTLIAEVDDDNMIEESMEDNNMFRKDVGIYSEIIMLPDLAIKLKGDAINELGADYNFEVNVLNAGNLSSEISNLHMFISDDAIIDSLDYHLSPILIGDLAAGKNYLLPFSLPVPQIINTPLYVIVMVDLPNEIKEINEENNVVFLKINNSSQTGVLLPPDLVISGHRFSDVPKERYNVADTIKVSYKIINIGQGKTGATFTGLFLSKDDNFSTDDILLGQKGYLFYEGAEANFSIPVSDTLEIGDYYLIAVADFKDFTFEVNENNNTYIHQMKIEDRIMPDLIFSKFSLSDYELYGGDKFTFDTQITNQGTDTTNAWQVHFYLNTAPLDNNSINKTEPVYSTPIYERYLSPEQSISFSYEMRLLNSIIPGKYFMGACINHEGLEKSGNNCISFEEAVIINQTITGYAISRAGNDVHMFPNPSGHHVNFITTEKISSVKICSSQGIEQDAFFIDNRIDVSRIDAGIYMVEIVTPISTYRKKLVVQ